MRSNSVTKTVKDRLSDSIKRSRTPLFMRSDFKEIATYSAVDRALKKLQEDGTLIKVSRGVYLRARESSFNIGVIVPTINIQEAMNLFLDRMGRERALSYAEQEYNSRKSTQVPAGGVVGYRGEKISRCFSFAGRSFSFENVA